MDGGGRQEPRRPGGSRGLVRQLATCPGCGRSRGGGELGNRGGPGPVAGLGHVSAVFVDPDHWRRGIARRMLDAAEAAMLAAGHDRAQLWTLEGSPAEQLYTALGWRRDGRGWLTPRAMDRTPVIVGIGLSDYPKAPHLDSVQHHVLAMQRALEDCGIEKSEIDGYVNAAGGMMVDDPVTMAEYLRIDHRYIDGTMTGGSSFEFHVQHAAAVCPASAIVVED